MAKRVLKTREELVDFVQGCLLYGVGGGGNPAEGLKALANSSEAFLLAQLGRGFHTLDFYHTFTE